MKINRIDHVAVALRDIDDGKRTMRLLGLAATHDEEYPEYQAKMANFPVDGVDIELIEGTSQTPIIGPYLDSNPEGVFHICLEVEDIDSAIEELTAEGVKLMGEPMVSQGRRVVFLDPGTTSKIFIELAEPHPV